MATHDGIPSEVVGEFTQLQPSIAVSIDGRVIGRVVISGPHTFAPADLDDVAHVMLDPLDQVPYSLSFTRTIQTKKADS